MILDLSGNQALAYGALNAGVDVAAGYPGTPSSEALGELISLYGNNGERRAPSETEELGDAENFSPSPYVEWSTNEKVALEIAAGAAWSGKRALATMKMSGANVALDSLISIAYSGTRGGLVIYIADDPGAEAGMPEQDTRLLSLFTNLPVLEPANPRRVYELTPFAFRLSEETELPVILRSVTTVAHSLERFEIDPRYHFLDREADFLRDIRRFTKAGAQICMEQHRSLLEANQKAVELFREEGLNRVFSGLSGDTNERYTDRIPPSEPGGKGMCIIGAGAVIQLIEEQRREYEDILTIELEAVNPLDESLVAEALERSGRVVVFEELEPVLELQIRSIAERIHWTGRIIGKLDRCLPRIGRYSAETIRRGMGELTREDETASIAASDALSGPSSTEDELSKTEENLQGDIPGVKHTITFCEGCPHRGTYLALNRALKKTKLGPRKTVVTGDIGCTILGMNPPFDSCWTEVSMGSSIGFAQGFARAGIRKPLVATIGDSTFFHAGIPPLINAVQHGTDMLLIILDNGWTSMTGFQVNPGTDSDFQKRGGKRVDISALVRSVGVDMCAKIKPFDQEGAIETLSEALTAEGVRVVIAEEECALTRLRRETVKTVYSVDPEVCTFCKVCIRETGCPALYVDKTGEKPHTAINPYTCTGCSLCYSACTFGAISPKSVSEITS
ncbi:MAG: thiamine pyrophosphate-dependent enzyme [Spirochaetaceae bacterium]